MNAVPPPAEELRLLDHELRQLDARRAQLLARRSWLLGVLAQTAQTTQATWQAPPAQAAPPAQPMGMAPAPFPQTRKAEAAPPTAQNALLTLGGILLTVAAIAFTLVSWGHLGIGGRSAVLAAVTCAALAAPALLLRRGLRSTAEAVAGLGLVLTVLDAYALHRVVFTQADPVAYTAAACAVLAGLWTAYGLVLDGLRLPVPAAVVTAQLPLLLWAVSLDAGVHTLTGALLVTAAGDTALALWSGAGRLPVRITAAAAAGTVGGLGLASAGTLSATAEATGGAARAGALLLLGAASALYAAWRAPNRAVTVGGAAVAGLAVVAAMGGVLRTALPPAWVVPGYLLCGSLLVLVTLAGTSLPRPWRLGLAGAGGAVQALALLWTVPVLVISTLGPARWVDQVWAGAEQVTFDFLPGPTGLAVPVTLLALAATAAAAYRGSALGRRWRPQAACTALVLAWAAATTLPAVLQLPYAAGLSLHSTLAAAALALSVAAARTPHPASGALRPALAVTALGTALTSAVTACLLSLATRPATFAVLGALLLAFAAAAALHTEGGRRSVTACVAVALSAGLALAWSAALELPPHRAALLLLMVPLATTLLGARLRARRSAMAIEIAGAVAATLAIGLALGHTPSLALVLSLVGVLAAGTAIRPERRPVRYAAAALFAAACWVRLAAWDVEAPEAYTLPVTVPALIVGALRHRRDASASSWATYGPGLAVTLVPSLLAVWSDPHWLRPLLLGVAALLVTLAGARYRLQAPLALGGTVLALDALHELAPYVVQVVDALPRWLPPALAGLLLLAVGATYEQRLRDARRMRDALGRMR